FTAQTTAPLVARLAPRRAARHPEQQTTYRGPLWDELLLYLENLDPQHRPQIVMLQESHWGEHCARTFNSGRWKVITSPATDNQSAGVATLLDRGLCSNGQVLHTDPIPGRLLHVRLQRPDWTLDTYNVYRRQIGQGRDTAEEVRALRNRVWQAFEAVLARAPQRHTILAAGDFNCPLREGACAGPRCAPQDTKPPADQSSFLRALEDHHMIQVNSWQRQAGATYYHAKGQTLIDHVLLRKSQCDQRAKTAKPVKTSLAAWRQGSYHLPVLCSLPVHRFHSLNKPKQPKREWNHWDLIRSLRDPHSSQLQAFRQAVAAGLSKAVDAPTINALLCSCASQVFPPQVRPQRLTAWQTQPMQVGIKGMWQAYAQWKRVALRGNGAILRVWRSYATFRKAQRDFRKAGKQARKQWFSNRLQDLQQAAARKDMRALFAGMRTMAPKKKKSEVQLKSPDGHLQSAEAQIRQLRVHYQQVYKRDPQKPPPTTRAQLCIEVTEAEVQQALSSLLAHKATPPHLASTAMWKGCSDLLTPLLTQWATGLKAVPGLWKDAWLVLIPKKQRIVSPRDLRPIGLTEASGRALSHILQQRLRPYVERYLHQVPQYAYLREKHTGVAIARAQHHNLLVQQACECKSRTVMDAYENKPRQQRAFAGCQLSLDLTSAFDVADWGLIQAALEDADIPHDLRAWALSWYDGITYHIQHLGQQAKAEASRGLRQGCKLAPLIWALLTAFMHKQLALSLDAQWLAQGTTTFADDFLLQDTAENYLALERASTRFATILDSLADHGMCINAKKSAFLIRYRGHFARKWMRQHTVRTPEGDYLRIRTKRSRLFEFPIKDQHTYLGVVLSYHSAPKQTVAHRIKEANGTWQRLRPILCSRSYLSEKDRVRLWSATVLPTLVYGVSASSPGIKDVQQMQYVATRHLRAIARSFAHISKESTLNLLARLRVAPIHKRLLQEATALSQTLLRLEQAQHPMLPAVRDRVRETAAALQAAQISTETADLGAMLCAIAWTMDKPRPICATAVHYANSGMRTLPVLSAT
ncbi:Pol, partial [Symbiodinium sp. CCMP2456]